MNSFQKDLIELLNSNESNCLDNDQEKAELCDAILDLCIEHFAEPLSIGGYDIDIEEAERVILGEENGTRATVISGKATTLVERNKELHRDCLRWESRVLQLELRIKAMQAALDPSKDEDRRREWENDNTGSSRLIGMLPKPDRVLALVSEKDNDGSS